MPSGYHITNLRISYGEKLALAIESLYIKPGSMVALIGPNGSGKSTFLAAMAGLLPLATEAIFFNDRPLSALSLEERAQKLTFLPPRDDSDPHFSALEVVLLAQLNNGRFGFANKEELINSHKALAILAADDLAERPIGTLSSGERQRVALARLLARKAPLMLLDEPNNYLDPLYQHLLLRHLQELALKEQETIIIAIHDLPLAARYFEYFFLFNHGKLVATLSKEELRSSPLLATVFQVPLEILLPE